MNDVETETSLNADARASVTIGRPAHELRTLWLRPDTQSRIWAHFAEVTTLDGRTAEWIAHGPAGGEYRWRTEIDETDTNELRWSTREGADVPNTGVLAFRAAPGDRVTELHLIDGLIPTMRTGDVLGHDSRARSSMSGGR